MIFKRSKPDSFREQFPDYPIKPVPTRQKLHIAVIGVATGLGLMALVLGFIFILSEVKIPTPLIVQMQPGYEEPQNEEEMFKSLSVEQLHPIGETCAENKDSACARTVYQRILELAPQDRLALGQLAVAEASLGLHAEALQHMREFIQTGGREQLRKSKVTRFIDTYLESNDKGR